jgi:hypothetical protein
MNYKSKFTPLLKLKKQTISAKEQTLMQCNNNITIKQKEIDQNQEDMLNLSLPTQGNFALYSYMQEQKRVITIFAKQLKKEEEWLKAKKINIQNELKYLEIEYEKFNYLHQNEVDKKIEKLKKEEAKMLDEVAIIGYNRKKDNL